MFCGNCGANVPEGCSFCPNCGANISNMQSASGEPVAEPVMPEAETTVLSEEPATQPVMPEAETTLLSEEPAGASAPQGFQTYEQPLTSAPAQVLGGQYQEPTASTPTYAQPEQADVVKHDFSTSVLVFGILAAALCELGIFGIIFGIIARVKAKNFLAENGMTCGKSRIGSNLGMVGIIAGIFFMIFWIVYIAFIATAISSASRYGYNFHY